MTLLRNKDGELWDDETGHVYNDDGTVKRPGLPFATPAAKATVAKAAANALTARQDQAARLAAQGVSIDG